MTNTTCYYFLSWKRATIHFLHTLLLVLVIIIPSFSQDLIVANTQNIPTPATYDNVIVQSGGLLIIDGELTVTQNMTIEAGGTVRHSSRFEPGIMLIVNGILDVQVGGTINTDGRGLKGGSNGSVFVSFGEAYDQSGAIVQGSSVKFGGSHGGRGAQSTNSGGASNPCYGLIEAPDKLGAGGGGGVGGNGGGRIRIEANEIIIDGIIRADGVVGQAGAFCGGGGGGAGGSIWISATTISGSGSIRSKGGPGANNCQGGGGGGRVSIEYEALTFPPSNINVSGHIHNRPGGAGTVYLKDINEPKGEVIFDNNGINGTYFSPILTNLSSFKKITIRENAELTYDLTGLSTQEGFVIDGGKLTLEAGSILTDPKLLLTNGTVTSNIDLDFLTISDFTIENQSSFVMGDNLEFRIPAFDMTNAKSGTFHLKKDALLLVGSNQIQINTGVNFIKDGQFGSTDIIDALAIEDGGNITHSGHLEEGLNLQVTGQVEIKNGGSVNVNGKGLFGGGGGSTFGGIGEAYDTNGNLVPGSDSRNGASHGGRGASSFPGGSPSGSPSGKSNLCYGLIESPDKLGAGGSGDIGGNGGGRIRMNVGNLILDGSISANGVIGQAFVFCGGGGGGAGGSIWVTTGDFSGTGTLEVKGGPRANSCQGGGGGGRIAVEYNTNSFPVDNISAAGYPNVGGASVILAGGAGSIYLKNTSEPNGELIVDNDNTNGYLPTPILSALSNFNKITVKDQATLLHDLGTIETDLPIEVITNAKYILDTFAVLTNPQVHLNQGNFIAHSDLEFSDALDFQMDNNSYLEIGAVAQFSLPTFDAANFTDGTAWFKEFALLNISSNEATINTGLTLIKHGKFGPNDELSQFTIEDGGIVTHQVAFRPGLTLKVTNTLELKAGGKIDVTGKGLRGGNNSSFNPNGEAFDPDGNVVSGATEGVGGSYGGEGALVHEQNTGIMAGNSNLPYGKIEDPIWLGSGSGGPGGNGGGRVFIDAIELILQGDLKANGGNGSGLVFCGGGGGGSGGSIWIKTQNLSGDGLIEAKGGASGNSCQGAGGGGRVAIEHNANSFQENNINAYGGATVHPGSNGTVLLKDLAQSTNLLIFDNNNLNTPLYAHAESDETEFEQIIVKNKGKGILPRSGNIRFPFINPTNCISGTLAIPDDLNVELDDYNLEINTGFTLEKSGKIGADTFPQILIRQGGSISHMAGSLGGLYLKTLSLTIEPGGSINVSAKGLGGGRNGSQFGFAGETYAANEQSIAAGAQFSGSAGAGASYGGLGGNSNAGDDSNPVYGDRLFPNLLGSGGAGEPNLIYGRGGRGGGCLTLDVDQLTVEGTIRANGQNLGHHAGGGSGGSLLIFAETIQGDGQISANGGNCPANPSACGGPSGGGGRIAIYTHNALFPTGNIFVNAGSTPQIEGDPGSIVYLECTYENNVGIDTVLCPKPGVLIPDTTIIPVAVVRNYSPSQQVFPTTFTIGSNYTDETFVNLLSGQRDTIEFAPYTTDLPGTIQAVAQTNNQGDDCIQSNQKTVNIAVNAGAGPVITEISPDSGGNTGAVTVGISGENFKEGITASLATAGNTLLVAHFIDFQNPGLIYASFNLQGMALGMYDVIVRNPDMQTSTFTDGFEVKEGTIGWGGFAQPGCLAANFDPGQLLEIELDYPFEVRFKRTFILYVRFKNVSNIDLPVQTRTLVSTTEDYLSFLPETIDEGLTELTVELKEEDGPPNILRAGASGSIKVYAKAIHPLTVTQPERKIEFDIRE